MRVICLLACLMFSIPLYAQKPAKPAEPVKDPISCSMLTDGMPCVIRRQMIGYYGSLETFQADFKLSSFDSQLNINDVAEGKIAARRAGNQFEVRIDFAKPQETMYLENGKLTIYRPRINQAMVTEFEQDENQLTALTGLSRDDIETRLTYGGYETAASGASGWRMTYTPKSAFFNSIDLLVSYGEIVQISIPRKDGDKVSIAITNSRKNDSVINKGFRLRLFKDVKITKAKIPADLKF